MDHVDVERHRQPKDAIDDRSPGQLGQARAAAGAHHQLGGVLALGEVDEGGRNVAAGHPVIGPAQLGEEQPVLLEELGRLAHETVVRLDVHPEQVTLGPYRHARRATDQLLAARRAGQRDDDAFAGIPGAGDAVVGHVPLE